VNCHNWTGELVECARAGSQPFGELRRHLSECPRCQERWENECGLSAQFRGLRAGAAARRPSEAGLDRIMREYELAHLSRSHVSLMWALSAAAVLLLAIGLGYMWRSANRSAGNSQGVALQAAIQGGGYVGGSFVEELPEDSDFIAVPYAAPLATGEFVRVIRTELRPIELARMGVYLDGTLGTGIPVDVLMGQDGFPRAVRVFGDMD
jgi:hypothetical protein